MNTTTEQLAEQLRELKLEHPQPGAVTARVLAAAARPAPRWRRSRLAIAVALLLAAGPVAWGVLYFSPSTAAVLADAGPGGFSSEMLDRAGLGTGSIITAQSSLATSSGYTVQLVGAYADSIRTVVLLKTTPAAWPGYTGIWLMTDQFGTGYSLHAGVSNGITGEQAITFEPPSALASVTGMRFTLNFDRVSLYNGSFPPPPDVHGTWKVKGVVLLHSGTNLGLPAEGSLGSGTVKFVEARYSGRIVLIRADVRGVSLDGYVGVEGPKNKPIPRFRVEMAPADGGPPSVGGGGGWGSASGSPTRIEALFYNVDPGTYRLTMTLAGAGTLTRTLVVR